MPKVLITGANRGIGLEFARQYAADGWQVVATVREPASATELKPLGVQVEQLDMRDFDALAGFGPRIDGALDLLIANAGTWIPEQAETADDGRAWLEMMAANCIGPLLLARAVTPAVSAARGKMIALSSGMGSIADSSGGHIPYRTSKAALNMAWNALAIDVKAQRVIAATIDPGWVQTRMGGPDAPLPAERSVADMRALIDRLGPSESGGFFRRDGTRHAW